MRYLDKNNFVNSATPDPYGSREVLSTLAPGVFVKYSQSLSTCSWNS